MKQTPPPTCATAMIAVALFSLPTSTDAEQVGHWVFAEGSGTVYADSSPDRNDGRPAGGDLRTDDAAAPGVDGALGTVSGEDGGSPAISSPEAAWRGVIVGYPSDGEETTDTRKNVPPGARQFFSRVLQQ